MAVLSLSSPPSLGPDAKYPDYKDWLLDNFYYYLCSYCLLHNPDVQVEHYEPISYAPDREHDPKNLLLGCPTCNGSGGKWDYHPKHAKRRKRRDDISGYSVADVRVDDFASMFCVDAATGKIGARSGPQRDRAAWNITLLKLDLPYREKDRRDLCDAVVTSEKLITAIEGGATGKDRAAMQAALQILLRQIEQRFRFLEVHGIRLPAAVQSALSA